MSNNSYGFDVRRMIIFEQKAESEKNWTRSSFFLLHHDHHALSVFNIAAIPVVGGVEEFIVCI